MLVSLKFSNNWVVNVKDEKWKIREWIEEHENRVTHTLSETLNTYESCITQNFPLKKNKKAVLKYSCVTYWKQTKSGAAPLGTLACDRVEGCKGQKRIKAEIKDWAHTPAAQEELFKMQGKVTALGRILLAATSWHWCPDERESLGTMWDELPFKDHTILSQIK